MLKTPPTPHPDMKIKDKASPKALNMRDERRR
jgi:hypothetical protein